MAEAFKVTLERVEKLERGKLYFHSGNIAYIVKTEGRTPPNVPDRRTLVRAAAVAFIGWVDYLPTESTKPSKLEITIPVK